MKYLLRLLAVIPAICVSLSALYVLIKFFIDLNFAFLVLAIGNSIAAGILFSYNEDLVKTLKEETAKTPVYEV